MTFLALYLAAIVGVNAGFSYLPFVETPLGTIPLMSFFVGFIFVIRDYAQRVAGNHILWAMLVGCVISWYYADPNVVIASVAAFAVSELLDYVMYAVTKRPFHQRVLISSAVSVPADSIIFLLLIGVVNPAAMLAMSISKMGAAVFVWAMYTATGRKQCSGT